MDDPSYIPLTISLEDPDNDHLTNMEEFLMGTDPNVADVTPLSLELTPVFMITGVAIVIIGIAVWKRRY